MSSIRKPWYRPRNVLLGLLAALVVWFGWALSETLKVHFARPDPRVDSRARLRVLSEQAAGVSREAGQEAWSLLLEIFDHADTPGLDDDVDFRLVLEGPTLPADIGAELEAIALLRERGVFDLLGQFAAGPPGLDPIEGDGPVALELLKTGPDPARALALARTASMRLALAEGNFAEVAAAFDQVLALGRTMSCQPFLLSHLSSRSIHGMALGELDHELMEAAFPEDVRRALLASIDRHASAPFEIAMESERVYFHDFVQWSYSDDGHGDGYLVAAPIAEMAFGVEAKGSILDAAESRFFFASRADALEVSDDLIDRLIGVSRLDPSERLEAALDLDAFVNRLPRRHKLTRVTIPAVGEFVKNQAIARLRIVSTRLMVALEAYRASTGSFPDALEDLVPGIVGHLPADPVAGGPFMYRLVEDDPHGRPYLLYVTGLDLVDDGGNELPGAGVQINWTLPLRETWCGGFDVVVNTPRPLPDE